MVEIKAIAALTRDDISRLAQCAARRQDQHANPFEQGSFQHSQYIGDYQRELAD